MVFLFQKNGENNWHCPDCDKECVTFDAMRQHGNRIHEKRFRRGAVAADPDIERRKRRYNETTTTFTNTFYQSYSLSTALNYVKGSSAHYQYQQTYTTQHNKTMV